MSITHLVHLEVKGWSCIHYSSSVWNGIVFCLRALGFVLDGFGFSRGFCKDAD